MFISSSGTILWYVSRPTSSYSVCGPTMFSPLESGDGGEEVGALQPEYHSEHVKGSLHRIRVRFNVCCLILLTLESLTFARMPAFPVKVWLF